MHELYSITFVHCQLYILLLVKCMFVSFSLFLFLFATFHGEIKISKLNTVILSSRLFNTIYLYQTGKLRTSNGRIHTI